MKPLKRPSSGAMPRGGGGFILTVAINLPETYRRIAHSRQLVFAELGNQMDRCIKDLHLQPACSTSGRPTCSNGPDQYAFCVFSRHQVGTRLLNAVVPLKYACASCLLA